MLTQYPARRYALVLCALLAASCGGGGSSSSPSTPLVSNNPPPPIDVTLTGKVMNGYLQGASVCLDANDNLRCDSGEITAVTNATGDYSLTVAAAQTASLISTRLIAHVPAAAIDADTKLAVGHDSILLTKPYVVGTTSYIFTPITTAVEIGVFAGLARIDAQAEALKRYGFSKLGLYDDYVAARAGANATEAAGVSNFAHAEFIGLHSAAIQTFKSPTSDYFNTWAGAGTFRETVSVIQVGGNSVSTPYGIFYNALGKLDATGNGEVGFTNWKYDAVVGYQDQGSITNTTPYPLFDTSGWLPISPQINGVYRFSNGRTVYSYGGKDLFSSTRSSEDLISKTVGMPYVVGFTPSTTAPAIYKQGSKGFSYGGIVILQDYGYAGDPEFYYDQSQFPIATVTSLASFTLGVNPNGQEDWHPITYNNGFEIHFSGSDVFFRSNAFGAIPSAPIASSKYSYVTYGKVTLLKITYPKALGLPTNFGLDPEPLYYAEYQGSVRPVSLSTRGSIFSTDYTTPLRTLNREGMESVAGALGWSPMPAAPWPRQ